MNMAEAMKILKSLTDLERIAEAMTTGDGRWQALQDWLALNPKWKKEVDSWVSLTPDEAFNSLRDYTAKRAGMEPIILDTLIDAGMKFRVKKSIQTLQAMYRERKDQGQQSRAEISDEWVVDKSPIPSAHKSIHDYQQQLKAKQKRKGENKP